jgi:hypothetical protein
MMMMMSTWMKIQFLESQQQMQPSESSRHMSIQVCVHIISKLVENNLELWCTGDQ